MPFQKGRLCGSPLNWHTGGQASISNPATALNVLLSAQLRLSQTGLCAMCSMDESILNVECPAGQTHDPGVVSGKEKGHILGAVQLCHQFQDHLAGL